jgi:hypothetical protein
MFAEAERSRTALAGGRITAGHIARLALSRLAFDREGTMTALVTWKTRQPFGIPREFQKAIRDAHSRLMTPERIEWWFNMGEADGELSRRYGGPKDCKVALRAYRIGWVKGCRQR